MLLWGWQTADTEAYEGINGFLGFRGSLMLDVVFLAMFLVLPVMFYAIALAKQQKFSAHKQLQVILGAVLFVAIVAFELDLQINGWRHRAEPSPYYVHGEWCGVWYSIIIHLLFAIPTFFLWIWVIVRALLKFPSPPVPGLHSQSHKFWGWLAALGMTGTTITGWIFYYVAFVATK
jgi:putative membrane protein